MPGEPVEVIALVRGQPKRAGECTEHLGRGLRSAGLLEPGVVVDRHPGQVRDLLTPEPGRPAARTSRQPDVGRCQRLAAATEEVSELGSVHPSIMTAGSRLKQGPAVRG